MPQLQLDMQASSNVSALAFERWSVAFVGEPVDDRGRRAVEFVRSNSNVVRLLQFDPITLEILVDGTKTSAADLTQIISDGPVVLDATTLGIVEIFQVLRTNRDSGGGKLTLLYTEPGEYNTPERRAPLRRRDFELSSMVRNFTAVPGAALLLRDDDDARLAFLLGYEGQRLEQVLEQTGRPPSYCSVVFGVPAFRPGWEMNSFANNIRVVYERSIPSVHFAGAQNPAAVLSLLEQEQAASISGRLLIAPIGTKPQAIGAALYACVRDGVGLIYDYPTRAPRRSEDIAKWHLFNVELS